MATVIAIDLSVSMIKKIKVPGTNETYTLLQLAEHGVNTLLDYLAVHSRLESVAIVTFSHTCDILCSFTRDYASIKNKIMHLDFQTDTRYPPVIQTINYLVHSELSNSVTCQVIMITDGNCYQGLRQPDITPLLFPGKLIVVPLDVVSTIYKNNYNSNKLPNDMGYITCPELPLTPSKVATVFEKIAKEIYVPYSAMLQCGHLKSDVHLIPPPMVSYTKAVDFEIMTYYISYELDIVGFLESSKVKCPATFSRHLVLPRQSSDECTESNSKSLKIPSFCVLLHHALKAENMMALCQLGPNWFGLLVSWADNKNKSNLMLIVLEPGTNAIPWLGDIQNLTLMPTENMTKNNDPQPIQLSNNCSYNQSELVWIKEAGLQANIHKILRLGRKIPDKMLSFYKELNLIRKSAIAYGFNDLLTSLAGLLEFECSNLPGGTHPDCALQLTHAAMILRAPLGMDPNYTASPLIIKCSKITLYSRTQTNMLYCNELNQ